jgi:hypothetical protein
MIECESLEDQDKQILLISVLVTNYLPVMAKFDLYSCALRFDPSINMLIRSTIEEIIKKSVSVEIVAFCEWVLVISVDDATSQTLNEIAEITTELNPKTEVRKSIVWLQVIW